MDIKDRINLIIQQYSLTPSKFADVIGVQRSNISHILSGRNKPSLDFILKVLEKFPDISSDWLIKGEEDQNSIVVEQEEDTPLLPFQADQNLNEMPKPDSTFKGSKIENLPPFIQEPVKNQQENPLKQPQVDIKVQNDSVVQPNSEKRIKRVIVFYDDNSFEEFSSR